MRLIKCLLLPILCGLSFAAAAQWQWVEADGRKVFSDRAPPTSVPDKNIVKRPGAATTLAAASAVAATSAPTLPRVDKRLADKTLKAEQASQAQRQAQQERIRKAKADNCERAKLAKTALNSGVRLSRINPQGEREVMDDAAVAAEAQRLQSIMAAECQ